MLTLARLTKAAVVVVLSLQHPVVARLCGPLSGDGDCALALEILPLSRDNVFGGGQWSSTATVGGCGNVSAAGPQWVAPIDFAATAFSVPAVCGAEAAISLGALDGSATLRPAAESSLLLRVGLNQSLLTRGAALRLSTAAERSLSICVIVEAIGESCTGEGTAALSLFFQKDPSATVSLLLTDMILSCGGRGRLNACQRVELTALPSSTLWFAVGNGREGSGDPSTQVRSAPAVRVIRFDVLVRCEEIQRDVNGAACDGDAGCKLMLKQECVRPKSLTRTLTESRISFQRAIFAVANVSERVLRNATAETTVIPANDAVALADVVLGVQRGACLASLWAGLVHPVAATQAVLSMRLTHRLHRCDDSIVDIAFWLDPATQVAVASIPIAPSGYPADIQELLASAIGALVVTTSAIALTAAITLAVAWRVMRSRHTSPPTRLLAPLLTLSAGDVREQKATFEYADARDVGCLEPPIVVLCWRALASAAMSYYGPSAIGLSVQILQTLDGVAAPACAAVVTVCLVVVSLTALAPVVALSLMNNATLQAAYYPWMKGCRHPWRLSHRLFSLLDLLLTCCATLMTAVSFPPAVVPCSVRPAIVLVLLCVHVVYIVYVRAQRGVLALVLQCGGAFVLLVTTALPLAALTGPGDPTSSMDGALSLVTIVTLCTSGFFYVQAAALVIAQVLRFTAGCGRKSQHVQGTRAV